MEALARSGIGALTMIDLDDVCVTNVNRQLPALDGQIGRPKIDVLADRVAAINPACRVDAPRRVFHAATAARLLAPGYDFVIDATDKLANKCVIITGCRERGIPVLTCGGAGGRRDGTAVRVCDLAHSVQDELLRQVRRKLRREFAFPRDPQADFGVPCVYLAGEAALPVEQWHLLRRARARQQPHARLRHRLRPATLVTGAFGFAAAGEVVRRLALG